MTDTSGTAPSASAPGTVLFVDADGASVGAALRWERDGHRAQVALTPEAPDVGTGLVPVTRLASRDVRGVTRLLADGAAGTGAVVVASPGLWHLTGALREAVGPKGPAVYGPERLDGVSVPLRWDTRFRGRVRVGDRLLVFYRGGAVFQPGTEKVLGAVVRIGNDPLPLTVDSRALFLTEFLSDEGTTIRATEALVPAVVGPLLEMVEGDVGGFFAGPRWCLRSTGVALAVDPGGPGARLTTVTDAALRHLWPVAARLEDTVLASTGPETLAFTVAWGVDVYEATRRCYRTLERCGAVDVKVKGQMATQLGALLGTD